MAWTASPCLVKVKWPGEIEPTPADRAGPISWPGTAPGEWVGQWPGGRFVLVRNETGGPAGRTGSGELPPEDKSVHLWAERVGKFRSVYSVALRILTTAEMVLLWTQRCNLSKILQNCSDTPGTWQKPGAENIPRKEHPPRPYGITNLKSIQQRLTQQTCFIYAYLKNVW